MLKDFFYRFRRVDLFPLWGHEGWTIHSIISRMYWTDGDNDWSSGYYTCYFKYKNRYWKETIECWSKATTFNTRFDAARRLYEQAYQHVIEIRCAEFRIKFANEGENDVAA